MGIQSARRNMAYVILRNQKPDVVKPTRSRSFALKLSVSIKQLFREQELYPPFLPIF
jgi:hypothetical protein